MLIFWTFLCITTFYLTIILLIHRMGSQPRSLLKKSEISNDCKSDKDLISLSNKSEYAVFG